MTHVINIAFQDRILPDDSPPLYGQRDKEMLDQKFVSPQKIAEHICCL